MISGRGLGHTGGTLDKLESIAGYRCKLSIEEFQAVVYQHGCAVVGATAELAPADKKLYALRDVTGTVPSLPLITASILSKKFAAGVDGVVLAVKVGSGAFMRDLDTARKLAKALISVGQRFEPVHGDKQLFRHDGPVGGPVADLVEDRPPAVPPR